MLAWLKKWGEKPSPGSASSGDRAASLPSAGGEGNPEAAWRSRLNAAHDGRLDKQFEPAYASLQKLLDDHPAEVDILNEMVQLCLALGKKDEALLLAARAAQLRPQSGAAQNNLGVVCASCLQHADALIAFRKALALEPGNAQFLRNALLSASELRDPLLMQSFLEAWSGEGAESGPGAAERPYFTGVLHLLRGELAEAEAWLRQSYAIARQEGGEYGIYLRFGYVLLLLGQREEALRIWQETAAAFPGEAGVLHNLAVVALEFGERARGKALLEAVLALQPDDRDSQLGLATICLAQGEYERGWDLYESRRHTPFLAPDLERFDPAMSWEGASLAGKSLLVWGEQGLGDQLQFIRYVYLLDQYAPAEVIVCCHPSLIALFSAVDRKNQYVSLFDTPPPCDLFVPMLSLPRIFATRLDSIPYQPYLQAGAQARAFWRERLQDDRRFRIGLVWGGNPRRYSIDLERTDSRRSVALAHFSRLWEVPGVSFYSLQKGEAAAQLADWPQATHPLIDWTDELHDFVDTAALIVNLDLVISVDTSVVHLAAALGKPVWVLSRLDGCWRWLLERDDSPWYPSVRLFRQPLPGDWSAVMQALHTALCLHPRQAGRLVAEDSGSAGSII